MQLQFTYKFLLEGEILYYNFLLQEAALGLLGGLAAATATSLGSNLVVHLADEIIEEFLNIDRVLGRGLEERAVVELGCEVLAVLLGNDALVLEIALVANKDRGEVLLVLYTDNLITDVLQIRESGLGDDAVDEDEALAVLHVEVTHSGELLSAGSIENLEEVLDAVDLNVLSVTVLNGRVVLLDEHTLHELHSDGRLAYTTASQHHDLVFLDHFFF